MATPGWEGCRTSSSYCARGGICGSKREQHPHKTCNLCNTRRRAGAKRSTLIFSAVAPTFSNRSRVERRVDGRVSRRHISFQRPHHFRCFFALLRHGWFGENRLGNSAQEGCYLVLSAIRYGTVRHGTVQGTARRRVFPVRASFQGFTPLGTDDLYDLFLRGDLDLSGQIHSGSVGPSSCWRVGTAPILTV